MLDCLVIGGGAAGLTAGVYLARFERNVVVLDAGESRLRRIPLARNVPGFAEGIKGEVLLARLVKQAQTYGCQLVAGAATAFARRADGFEVTTSVGPMPARTLLLAMGVAPIDPEIDGLEAAIERGFVRYCPICDGFEVRTRKLAVLAHASSSLEEARFLRTYTDDITFILARADARLSADDRARASQAGIRVLDHEPMALRVAADGVQFRFADRTEVFDALYPCLGTRPAGPLLQSSGVEVSEEGAILVDPHQRTSAPGIYAAGDVVEGLDQIAVAFGHAATAATTIHNDLRAGLCTGRMLRAARGEDAT